MRYASFLISYRSGVSWNFFRQLKSKTPFPHFLSLLKMKNIAGAFWVGLGRQEAAILRLGTSMLWQSVLKL
ncbi:hypothetical protein H3V17_00750 [Bartonella sp. M0283]|uniref:hypothetical protein n=1 Tax=Bartonella sp. M0283 TaxID=2751016 RepID=UPI0018DC1A09|nr:hypothetical protein [Bartonella sp. M0283]MBI0162182.1 hypothetical protein [Bartonella sp. M0283]